MTLVVMSRVYIGLRKPIISRLKYPVLTALNHKQPNQFKLSSLNLLQSEWAPTWISDHIWSGQPQNLISALLSPSALKLQIRSNFRNKFMKCCVLSQGTVKPCMHSQTD